MSDARTTTPRPRVPALDLLRGTAVAGMIVVNAPGDWGAMYAPLRHAAWNGWTPTDMVFPTFLFAAGVALGLSFPRRDGDGQTYWLRLARRVAALLALGLALEATYNLSVAIGWASGDASLSHLRLPGVLQRIALCYGLAAVIAHVSARAVGGALDVRPAVTGMVIAAVLLLYWAALSLVPFGGAGAGRLDPCGNLVAAVDRAIVTIPHMWTLGGATEGAPPCYDPEGLLSTLPATVNVLFGVLAARIVRRGRIVPLMALGAALMLAGLALDPLFPINKRIWTSSFALLSSGFSCLALAAFVPAGRGGSVLAPLRVLGGNAILAYVASQLLGRVYGAPVLPDGVAPSTWLDQAFEQAGASPNLASLLCSLLMLALVIALIAPLHRRGLHLRL